MSPSGIQRSHCKKSRRERADFYFLVYACIFLNHFLFRHRVLVEWKDEDYEPSVIENCENWEFKCPLAEPSALIVKNPDASGADFCTVCKKNVHRVHTMAQLKENVCNKDGKEWKKNERMSGMERNRMKKERRGRNKERKKETIRIETCACWAD